MVKNQIDHQPAFAQECSGSEENGGEMAYYVPLVYPDSLPEMVVDLANLVLIWLLIKNNIKLIRISSIESGW